MILHKMLFLHLPYTDVDDFDALQADILRYPGYVLLPSRSSRSHRNDAASVGRTRDGGWMREHTGGVPS
jgi:hypothetical protein